MNTDVGRFVWYELMTTDPKAAMEFYSGVVGWKTQLFGDGSGAETGGQAYHLWVSSQGPVGGVMSLPDEVKKAGAPPHWASNVTVADVDATLKKARELGGRVIAEPMDMPDIGRVAGIADPQGATLFVFKPASPMPPLDTTKQGAFSWNELMTSNHGAAFEFYSALFGWERVAEHDMGPEGKYLLFGKDGKAYGGMFTKPADMPAPTSWLYYIQVDDLEGPVAKATGAGAKLLNGPMDVPGGTRVAQLLDPQGAAFALHAPGSKKG